jgi:phenylpropionate dioxygenase-like ring-hydroxylating dioxygenase large terminal subunit
MTEDTLSPFPEGWYFVTTAKSLRKSQLIQKTWMGVEIVAWCDEDGRSSVAESVCPHLGSELGPAAGGRVRDGCLVCPFHGYEFDLTGQCVATPFAPPPRTAKLRVFETRKLLGMVFAWWGIDGRPPQWSLPEDPPGGADWSALKFRTLRFRGHPQETSENAVDMAHLRYVHGYGNVGRVGAVELDGAHLQSSFDFKRVQGVLGIVNLTFDVSATAHVVGLGYSFVEFHERSVGMDGRLWVLSTPVDGTLIDLVLVSQLRRIRKPKRPIVGLRFLPPALRTQTMNRLMLFFQEHDVMQDVVVWSRKRYRSRPSLCRSDGEIGMYRRYCRQFYAEPARRS